MKTQQDNPVRVVALENLIAMCARNSGVCHRYRVERITKTRVHVSYSNPDEYGNERPLVVVFPCYPSGWPQDGADNPRVVLDIVRVYGGRDSYDREGAADTFYLITNAPVLWRDPATSKWETEEQIKERQAS
jgi:hypothetical protein